MKGLRVFKGILGWSNNRSGCEFYQDVPNPRWETPREAYLTDAMGDPEGCRVIVVVAPNRYEDFNEVYDKVVAALAEEE